MKASALTCFRDITWKDCHLACGKRVGGIHQPGFCRARRPAAKLKKVGIRAGFFLASVASSSPFRTLLQACQTYVDHAPTSWRTDLFRRCMQFQVRSGPASFGQDCLCCSVFKHGLWTTKG